jgi:hypothetical protein
LLPLAAVTSGDVPSHAHHLNNQPVFFSFFFFSSSLIAEGFLLLGCVGFCFFVLEMRD